MLPSIVPDWYSQLERGKDLVNRLVLLVRELGFEENEIPSNPLCRFDFLIRLLFGEWKNLFIEMVKRANETDDFKKRRQMGDLFVEAVKFLKEIPFPEGHQLNKEDFQSCFEQANAPQKEYEVYLDVAFG